MVIFFGRWSNGLEDGRTWFRRWSNMVLKMVNWVGRWSNGFEDGQMVWKMIERVERRENVGEDG